MEHCGLIAWVTRGNPEPTDHLLKDRDGEDLCCVVDGSVAVTDWCDL
jgi:hypothetical protein